MVKTVLLACAVAVNAVSLKNVEISQLEIQQYVAVKNKFSSFKSKHSVRYTSAEAESKAFKTFQENDKLIEEHNAKDSSYKLAHNQFSDLSFEEYKATKLGGFAAFNAQRKKNYDHSLKVGATIADDVDWVAKGAVTPVKDQGQCGSCWAFSTTGSVEGANQIATGTLTSFSEQDLVSCDTDSDQGCNGGLMDNAFEYIKTNGLCTEKDYPYTAGGGTSGTCKRNCEPAVYVTSYTDVPEKDEDALLAALNKGPVSVAVEADKSAWQFYSSGVLDDASCGTSLDHGVLAVGYGTDGKDYYKVKNSWGASWGEEGYIRLVRGKNQCGIASAASYPVTGAPAPTAPTAPTPAPAPTAADDCPTALAKVCGDAKDQGMFECLLCFYTNEDSITECTEEQGEDWCEDQMSRTMPVRKVEDFTKEQAKSAAQTVNMAKKPSLYSQMSDSAY